MRANKYSKNTSLSSKNESILQVETKPAEDLKTEASNSNNNNNNDSNDSKKIILNPGANEDETTK